MIIKDGVSVKGLQPEILVALFVADTIWSTHGQRLVVTAGTDGEHKEGSLHYEGLAVDLRTRYFDDMQKQWVEQELRDALGYEYDVVLEPTHIHVEYDPK